MNLHGTLVFCGGSPDKQGDVFLDMAGVDTDTGLLGSHVLCGFGNSIKDVIPGSKVTAVLRRTDRVDIEVEVPDEVYVRTYKDIVDANGLYFACGGKIVQKEQQDNYELIVKASIGQVCLTPDGVRPEYRVWAGPLPTHEKEET